MCAEGFDHEQQGEQPLLMVWGVEQRCDAAKINVMTVFFHQLADNRHFDAQEKIAFAVFAGPGFEEALQDEGLRGSAEV